MKASKNNSQLERELRGELLLSALIDRLVSFADSAYGVPLASS